MKENLVAVTKHNMKSAMDVVKVMSRFLSARLLLKVDDNEF